MVLPPEILRNRLVWFIKLRWIVIGILLAVGTAMWAIYPSRATGMGLSVCAAALGAANGLYLWSLHRKRLSLSGLAWSQVLWDLIVLTSVCSLLGGIHNPFFALYLLHVILAGFILRGRAMQVVAILSACCVTLLVLAPCPVTVPILNVVWVPLAAVVPVLAGGTYLVMKLVDAERSAQSEAQQKHHMLSSILENMSEGIIFIGADGETRLCNPAALRSRAFGGHPSNGSLVDTVVMEGVLADFQRGRREPKTLDHSFGSRAYLSTFSPVFTPEDRLDSIVWSLLDVTERKNLEHQVMHQEKMAALGQLAAGLAHEIGNPLSSISGLVQMIRRRDGAPRAELDLLHEQIERIDRIVRDVTTFSRQTAESKRIVDINRVIQDTIRVATIDRRWRKFELVTDLATPSPQVLGNPDKLLQVFLNLLLNSADAMETGGKITVRSERVDEHAVVTFEDTGPGIPADLRGRVFDPFFTTKPPGRGTGLGLTVAWNLVAEHGGTIRLSDSLVSGACFVIQLPLEDSYVRTDSAR